MQLDFFTIFSFLFPLSDDEQLLAGISKTTFIKTLQVGTHKDITTLSSFKDPRVRAAIHLVKFHNNEHAFVLLGALVQSYLSKAYPEKEIVLVPLPLSAKRKRTRGYNQVMRIIQNCTLPQNVTCAQLLIRTKHTVPQTSLARTERLTNLQGAFAVKTSDQKVLAGKHIIVLDDVTTTGTTLREAKRTLAQCSPASVTCVALAH